MCAVPSLVVFCSEPMECFPGTVSRFFLKLLVTPYKGTTSPIPTEPLLLLLNAIELSVGGSSPSTSTDKTNKNK